jgi:hypothetical protein
MVQLLLDSADVQLLLQASMAGHLELTHLELKGVSSVLRPPSLLQLLECAAGTGSTGGSSSSSSSSKRRQVKQRKADEQQHKMQYLQVPPFHTQLLDALGIPTLEVRWATTPGAPADSVTPPGTHDREFIDALAAVTLPSALALKARVTGKPSSRSARELQPQLGATVRLAALKL